ncbi:glycosyltransferase family protein [Pontibacter pamirensis]|uniref:glycosyltransferase family protein n=1 Tax=Pontibacter pamirensis TaxID=2562824 RepID=UPI0021CF4B25|nr:glycosyltransferase family protein [Pontibacter pamirensis]
MISIIICSVNSNMLKEVAENVKDTIGILHEIIAIDNRNGKYGICEAYNIGASKSKYDVLCFMHEDLIFHTIDWGRRVVEHLNDTTIGLIGVAGGTYKSKSLDAWGIDPIEFARMNVLQDYKSGRPQDHLYSNPFNEFVADVASVDGLWFCTRKEVWQNNKFDETTLKEFHFYDIDFSLQVLQSYRVCVVYDILLQHISEGSINRSWLENAVLFHNKWKQTLPYSVDGLYDEKKKAIEIRRAKNILQLLKKYRFSQLIYLQHYFRYVILYISSEQFIIDKNICKNNIRYRLTAAYKRLIR